MLANSDKVDTVEDTKVIENKVGHLAVVAKR